MDLIRIFALSLISTTGIGHSNSYCSEIQVVKAVISLGKGKTAINKRLIT